MAGAVLTVGACGACAILAVGLALAGGASAYGQRLAGAADGAALAAADAASGAASGEPCARAAEVAVTADASVLSCEFDELTVTVTVSGVFAGIPVAATARAGPPSTP